MKRMDPTMRTALIVSLGGFIFGFDASVISGVVSFVATEFGLNDFQIGFVVSAPTLGAIISSPLAGPISDWVGRKRVLITIALLYLISAAASALAPGYHTLVAARLLGGMAFCSLMIAPMYIAEISPPKLRGEMVSFNQLNIMLGFSAAYFANYMILKLSGGADGIAVTLGLDEHAWRWMLGLEILPAAAYFLLLFTIPESPRWLVLNQREADARNIIARLIGPAAVEQQIAQIRATMTEKKEKWSKRFGQLLSPKLRLALTIGLIVGIAQQITGINAIYFYAPSIFEQSGVGKDAAFAQAVWVGIINVVFTIIAMRLIDKLGRKPLLLGGLTGVFISMLLCAYGFYTAEYLITQDALNELTALSGSLQSLVGQSFSDDVAFKSAVRELIGATLLKEHESALIAASIQMNPIIVLVGILGFVASFAISLGPVMWVLFSEIFPNRIRGIAISFVGVINSIVSFGVQFMFPWQLTNIGSALTFLIYGLWALLGLALVWRYLPETKGKSLEELETELSRGHNGMTAPTGEAA